MTKQTWFLPVHEGIGHTLRDLLGRPVTSKKAVGPWLPSVKLVATYRLDEGGLGAAAVLDLRLGAHLGAALTMIPAGVAEVSVSAKQLDPALLDNTREVLNVGSRWFTPAHAPHVTLEEVIVGSIPEGVEALMKNPGKTMTVDVDIQGYKGGRLSLFAL